jgi:hypothetical protein
MHKTLSSIPTTTKRKQNQAVLLIPLLASYYAPNKTFTLLVAHTNRRLLLISPNRPSLSLHCLATSCSLSLECSSLSCHLADYTLLRSGSNITSLEAFSGHPSPPSTMVTLPPFSFLHASITLPEII